MLVLPIEDNRKTLISRSAHVCIKNVLLTVLCDFFLERASSFILPKSSSLKILLYQVLWEIEATVGSGQKKALLWTLILGSSPGK